MNAETTPQHSGSTGGVRPKFSCMTTYDSPFGVVADILTGRCRNQETLASNSLCTEVSTRTGRTELRIIFGAMLSACEDMTVTN